MPYKLKIRNITESELRADCPFIPDQDEFEMYISAFEEDIATLDFVTEITKKENFLIINLEEQSEEMLHRLNIEVQRIFRFHYFDKIRVESPCERLY